LHEALLPPAIETGPVRMSFVYEPMRQIGGDFVFAHTSRTGAMHVVLIDVAGHGVASALAVNRLHGELKRFFLLSDDPEPGMVINDLNAYVYAALACEGMFATAVCLRFDGPGAKVAWSSAGHPPAMLRSVAGAGVLELGSTCPMLGALPPELFDPSPRTMTMVPGDALIAFTDGLFECRDASGRELGLAQVLTLTQASPTGELGAIARELARASRAHRHGRVSDDTLVMEVRLGEVIGAPTSAKATSTTPAHG
jgi:sigma-B regulation protein RsbU (phosphoserine phosphatase)/two-component system sensor histidine kinase ChiS